MIAILLNDASFEQDIRELLMAFYPGETFTHKEEEAGEAELIVRESGTETRFHWM